MEAQRLELGFTETIAAVMAANMATVGFVAAILHAQRNPGFEQPWIVWAGMLLPIAFVLLAFLATGDLPLRSDG
jgi:hypothetical protein